MYNMLGYLEHRFATPGEARLTIAATRHEDGTFSSSSLGFHQQRGRLLRSLADVEGVSKIEFSDEVDADYAGEAGHAWIDIPVGLAGFAGSIATVVSAWLSVRPRKKADSVPGVRIELPGSALIITGEMGKQGAQTSYRSLPDLTRARCEALTDFVPSGAAYRLLGDADRKLNVGRFSWNSGADGLNRDPILPRSEGLSGYRWSIAADR